MQLITENSLDGWVDTHEQEARGVTVNLVARLVRTQCSAPEDFRFPLGDSIGQHGPDGWLMVPEGYPPYIPEGISLWEIGSNGDPKTKASGDYNARCTQIPTHDRDKITFIFVTPRSAYHTQWTREAQEEWKRDRQNDGWKGIRILDATSLADWLMHFPGVSAWLYSIINESSCDIEIPETRWKDIESIPGIENPCLTSSLFLCSREALISQVDDFFLNDQPCLEIQTHYPDHLIDFISAFIQSRKVPEQGKFYSNIIILENATDLKKFATLKTPHVFVLGEEGDPDKIPKLYSRAISNGHKIIRPRNVGGKVEHSAPILRMPSPSAVQIELEKAGFTTAQILASKSNGNLPCLLRILSETYGSQYWEQGHDHHIAQMSLIGAWDEKNCADLQAIEEMTGKAYEKWKNEFVLLPKRATASLRHHDNGIYYFISRYEGWHIGGSIFTQGTLERFFLMAERVLMAVSRSKLDPIQRILAAGSKDTACPSNGLANAVAEMLAIMATNADYWEQGQSEWLEHQISALVDKLLNNTSFVAWSNLGTLLPTLAEAAPQSFLRQLSSVAASEEFLNALSVQEISPFATNPMAAILWALECLAWSPDWFPQVVTLLGSLSEVTLPKNSGNRPDRTLSDIFSAWNPHTCAYIDSQIKQLTRLAKAHPQTAWRVILSIAPQSSMGRISFGTYMPHWRGFYQYDKKLNQSITLEEWQKNFEILTSVALPELLHPGILSLEELAKGITAIPNKVDKILNLFKQCVNTSEQKHAWELLSDILKWIGNRKNLGKNLSLLTETIEVLTPQDSYEQLKIYFNDSIPEYNDEHSFEEQLASWQKKQNEIVAEIFHKDNLKGVLRFASLVKRPDIVGYILAEMGTSETDISLLVTPITFTELDESATRMFSRAYIGMRYSQGADDWLQTFWDELSPTNRLEVLLSIPFCQSVLDLVKIIPKDLQQKYWEQVSFLISPPPSNIEYPIQNLIAVNRNGEVLQWLSWNLRKNIAPPVKILKALLLRPDAYMARFSHDAITMIEYLRNKIHCDDDLVRIEFLWQKAFHSHRKGGNKPECLNKKLLTDPAFFLEALTFTYKPRHQTNKSTPIDGNDKFLAEMFYHALDNLIPPNGFLFSTDTFATWLNDVLKLAKEADRYENACRHIGKILFHAGEDPSGLWIEKSVAAILNVPEYGDIRGGFHLESINSRGVYMGSEGIEEQNIAQTYRDKAGKLREEGFFIFAECVDDIAKNYEHQAQMERDHHLRDF